MSQHVENCKYGMNENIKKLYTAAWDLSFILSSSLEEFGSDCFKKSESREFICLHMHERSGTNVEENTRIA
jgi:hypothetical protein